MADARPWVRGELPWLQSGPLYRVHQDSWPVLDAFLDRWSYRRIQLDGRQMTTRQQAHFQLHAAFGFPEWCGTNWDAFNDCFGDFVEENDGALIAVLWRHIDVGAQAAPATTAEVGWALLECAFRVTPSLAPGTQWSVSLDVFVLGDGEDFDRRPAEPSAPS
jgi:RNAse (barnase) inhibitor barstar